MTASFPGDVKSFPTHVDGQGNIIYAQYINDIQNEIAAIEAILGTNPEGSAATVKERIAAIEAAVDALEGAQDWLILTEQADTPDTPAAGIKLLYAKTDGKVYTLDDAGVETEVGSGGGTGTAVIGGWTEVADSWVYASANTITVPSGAATIYAIGTKLRLKQGGSYKYFFVYKVEDTVLHITAGNVSTVANSAITDIAYSQAAAPAGFPDSFEWTPTLTGFSSDPTGTYKFSMRGALVFVNVQQSKDGTSNASTFYISPPFPYIEDNLTFGYWVYAKDNGSALTVPGTVAFVDDGGTIKYRVDKTMSAANGWTASGGKRCRFVLLHPFQ